MYLCQHLGVAPNSKETFFCGLSNTVHFPRDFWSTYHKLSEKRERIPLILADRSHIATNTTEKADLLNKFFSSFSAQIHTLLSPDQNHLYHVSMTKVPCTAEEVYKLLAMYKAKTSSGPDSILVPY